MKSSLDLAGKLNSGKRDDFAMKAHFMLECTSSSTNSCIVRWLPHGRAFKVYDKDRFVREILPRCLSKQKFYTSFQRQLNMYGFILLNAKADEKGAYYHKYFLRGRPDLCALIVRSRTSESSVRRSFDLCSEPDFYNMKTISVNGSVSYGSSDGNAELKKERYSLSSASPLQASLSSLPDQPLTQAAAFFHNSRYVSSAVTSSREFGQASKHVHSTEPHLRQGLSVSDEYSDTKMHPSPAMNEFFQQSCTGHSIPNHIRCASWPVSDNIQRTYNDDTLQHCQRKLGAPWIALDDGCVISKDFSVIGRPHKVDKCRWNDNSNIDDDLEYSCGSEMTDGYECDVFDDGETTAKIDNGVPFIANNNCETMTLPTATLPAVPLHDPWSCFSTGGYNRPDI